MSATYTLSSASKARPDGVSSWPSPAPCSPQVDSSAPSRSNTEMRWGRLIADVHAAPAVQVARRGPHELPRRLPVGRERAVVLAVDVAHGDAHAPGHVLQRAVGDVHPPVLGDANVGWARRNPAPSMVVIPSVMRYSRSFTSGMSCTVVMSSHRSFINKVCRNACAKPAGTRGWTPPSAAPRQCGRCPASSGEPATDAKSTSSRRVSLRYLDRAHLVQAGVHQHLRRYGRRVGDALHHGLHARLAGVPQAAGTRS